MRFLHLLIIGLLFFSCSGKNNGESGELTNTTHENSQDTSLMFLSARLAEGREDFQTAVLLYDQLIDIDSTKGIYFFKRAGCLMEFSQYEKSIEDFSKSIELNYRRSDCYYNLGLINMSLTKDSAAVECFKNSLLFNPYDESARKFIDLLSKKSKETKVI